LASRWRESLENRCRQLRERTGAQLAVVTLKSLEGGQIDDFAVKLFKHWGIGQKDKKNGILLLVAVDDRRARIEVGYGLEPIIPDALAGRIIDIQLRPHFRKQQYAAGLREAVNRLCELVEKGEPADQQALEGPKAGTGAAALGIAFSAIFVAVGGFVLGVGLGLPQGGAVMFGLVFAGFAMAFGFALAGVAAVSVHSIVGLLAALVGWRLAKEDGGRGGGRRRGRSSPWNWNWGGVGTYGGGGSSGGGWSSGGGGFSQGWGGFGGGSSGGGGASGSW
jgi:uncharacterized protein